ncbi:MAG: peroxidase [Frankiales bacterium]|nr:peroxidase [Frankiales bacterium]
MTAQFSVPAEPQGVLTPLSRSAIFLVATLNEDADPQVVLDLLADLSGLQRTVSFRVPDAGLACVAGVGAAVWSRLYSVPPPAGLHPFVELTGDTHHAPATPGDLLFHLRAAQLDLCFELAGLIMDRLRDVVTVVDEVHGFKYFDERDLLGFVDGTENPVGSAAATAVTVGAEDPAYAGGSYVTVQKYLHDLSAWNALPDGDQELVIGRRKLSNVELSDEAKPANSHVALNTITDESGNELQIVRDNMPFGAVGAAEFGTYYLAYSSSPEVTERMLRNMFIGDPPGNYDRILDFSVAVTGCLFFAPTADFLEDPPSGDQTGPSESAVPPAQPEPDRIAPPDQPGSLGVGSLKRSDR